MRTMTMELEQLIGKVIGDLGGTANAALVIVGDRLGGLETGTQLGCAVQRCLVFSGCNSHPATGSLQPVAIGAAVEPFVPPSRKPVSVRFFRGKTN